MAIRFAIAAFAAFVLSGAPAQAGCSSIDQDEKAYTVCDFDPKTDHLALFNLDPAGEPLRNFSRLAATLAADGKQLVFAMNAGMFDENLAPIGLYVEDATQAKKLNRRGGYGNFHLKPNGVFFIAEGKAGVLETERFARSDIRPQFATQSGPMLVIEGKIHPKFSETGSSLKIRNGVGVTKSGTVVFAISDSAVNFHEFARLFRDTLSCPNALFLDGSVSSLYSRELARNDQYLPLGPMVGVYEMQ